MIADRKDMSLWPARKRRSQNECVSDVAVSGGEDESDSQRAQLAAAIARLVVEELQECMSAIRSEYESAAASTQTVVEQLQECTAVLGKFRPCLAQDAEGVQQVQKSGNLPVTSSSCPALPCVPMSPTGKWSPKSLSPKRGRGDSRLRKTVEEEHTPLCTRGDGEGATSSTCSAFALATQVGMPDDAAATEPWKKLNPTYVSEEKPGLRRSDSTDSGKSMASSIGTILRLVSHSAGTPTRKDAQSMSFLEEALANTIFGAAKISPSAASLGALAGEKRGFTAAVPVSIGKGRSPREGSRTPSKQSAAPQVEFLVEAESGQEATASHSSDRGSKRLSLSRSYASLELTDKMTVGLTGSFTSFSEQSQTTAYRESLDGVRQLRDVELLQELHRASTTDVSSEPGAQAEQMCGGFWRAPSCCGGGVEDTVAAPFWLQFCGLLPMRACGRRERWSCTLISAGTALLLCAVFAVEAASLQMQGLDVFCAGEVCSELTLLADLPLAAGALLGLFWARDLRQANILGHRDALLVAYARKQGLLERWSNLSARDRLAMLGLWSCMVLERASLTFWKAGVNARAAIHVAALVLPSGVLMGMAYFFLHTCRGLNAMVDCYCFRFVESPDFGAAVRNWNTLQALIRKVSTAVGGCYLVVLTTALVTTLLPLLVRGSMLTMIPGCFILLGTALAFFSAGAVTYKCDRVPMLINSLHFGDDLDHGRQYVVDYVLNSRAGFHIFDVRVTGAMCLKVAYVTGAIAFGTVTTFVYS